MSNKTRMVLPEGLCSTQRENYHLILAVLENNSRRIETWTHITRMGRELSSSGRGGRYCGRSHGKTGVSKFLVRTTRLEMNNPAKQSFSSSRQNSKMPYLTLAQ